jgi:hypothetical protein
MLIITVEHYDVLAGEKVVIRVMVFNTNFKNISGISWW